MPTSPLSRKDLRLLRLLSFASPFSLLGEALLQCILTGPWPITNANITVALFLAHNKCQLGPLKGFLWNSLCPWIVPIAR